MLAEEEASLNRRQKTDNMDLTRPKTRQSQDYIEGVEYRAQLELRQAGTEKKENIHKFSIRGTQVATLSKSRERSC